MRGPRPSFEGRFSARKSLFTAAEDAAGTRRFSGRAITVRKWRHSGSVSRRGVTSLGGHFEFRLEPWLAEWRISVIFHVRSFSSRPTAAIDQRAALLTQRDAGCVDERGKIQAATYRLAIDVRTERQRRFLPSSHHSNRSFRHNSAKLKLVGD